MNADQGRNEVRWRSGQGESLAPPCSSLRSLWSKCLVLKKVLVILSGLLAPPAVIRHPIVIRGSGNCSPLAPLVTPLMLTLYAQASNTLITSQMYQKWSGDVVPGISCRYCSVYKLQDRIEYGLIKISLISSASYFNFGSRSFVRGVSGDGAGFWAPVTEWAPNWGVWNTADTALPTSTSGATKPNFETNDLYK